MTDLLEDITEQCPRPVRRPVMLQEWRNLASVHWRYPAEEVQRLLPPGFRVDTFDGSAWVGLLPFHMRRIRVPGTPPLGPLSTFPETNVRTYLVRPDGRRGVWFCSLDVTRLIPALVARATYRLPYCWAEMSIERTGDRWSYRSNRRWPRPPAGSTARSSLTVEVGAPVTGTELTDLDRFLSARWALGSTLRGPLWADVDHEPWPLRRARLIDADETLLRAAGLPDPEGEPHVLWSHGVSVRIGRPTRVAGAPDRRSIAPVPELAR